MVKCEVHNAVGKSEESEALDISCEYIIANVNLYYTKLNSRKIQFSLLKFNFPCSVSDGPVFRARPKSIEADNGASITLTCDVVGNPSPDILWIHEPNDKVK